MSALKPRSDDSLVNETESHSSDGKPSQIDVHVGKRVKLRRISLGMSQEELGRALGVTFQQVQKYERGVNRIGASRLYDLMRVLDVRADFFYEDMPPEILATTANSPAEPLPEKTSSMGAETNELIKAYYAIPDSRVRSHVYSLAKIIAQNAEGGKAEPEEA